ncbi:hypothetical protein [Pelagibius marinus]|uniref:hypothetical protein n=1 Tax=Pelagibius marinus TaxID=2762760 RepID=UPI00187328B6|nr:hypothetical protein [Pelagibius marinus]
MDVEELERSLYELNNLAQEEYRASLADIVSQTDDDEDVRLLRIGRLLGVSLKEPFARGKFVDKQSLATRAYREWKLKPESEFENAKARNTWQYKALEHLRVDPNVVKNLGGEINSVYMLVATAQSERGLWWFLATSCRGYICRNPKLRAEIKEQIEQTRRAGLDLRNITPETIVASGGLTMGAILVDNIPILGIMGAPVIAGFVFIIFSIGLDAFCRWSKQHEFYHVDFPNADEEDRSR